MIRWIVASSLRSRGVVVALAAVAMFVGVMQFRDMPRDVLHEGRDRAQAGLLKPGLSARMTADGGSQP